MGEEESVAEASKGTTANGDAAEKEKNESGTEKKEEVVKEGIGETKEEAKTDDKAETDKMEAGKEDVKDGEEMTEQDDKQEKLNKAGGGKEEISTEAMEVDKKEDENDVEEVEAEADSVKEENEKMEEAQADKESAKEEGSKRGSKAKSSAGGKDKNKKKEVERKKEEPKTPAPPTIDRPVRERKSVERLVAAIDNDASKELKIEKGPGTALKDIPNVAHKLSRKKTDDTFKLLHTILFGRRGKATQIKSNISRFSGFVWHDNEEKQKLKIKEKLDKCVKEKLVEICDVLDIAVSRANTKKEDIVIKLIEFLEAPHATTTELLFEKEQSSKGKKRKRIGKRSMSTPESTPSKRSNKSQGGTSRKGEVKKGMPDSEDESEEVDEEEEEQHEEENVNGFPEKSDDDMSEQAESEEKEDESAEGESEEEKEKQKRVLKKTSTKKGSAGNAKTKNVTSSKLSSPKSTPSKSNANRSKVSENNGSSPKVTSKKKTEIVKEKTSTPKKPSSKESTGKKVTKGKDRPKEKKEEPTDDQLRNAICLILKEVDFNTATFTDILKQLAERFSTELAPRKSSIKLMIQEELTKLADEADEEEEEGGDAAKNEKDERQPTAEDVKA